MAFDHFSFDPENGFLDNTYYEDTPANAREILQRQHNQTRDYINSVVSTLNSASKGFSGSESIASPAIEGVAGETVFEQLQDLKGQMNLAVEGAIPNASITEEKLSGGSVNRDKIAEGAVETPHFHPEAICPYAGEPLSINGKSRTAYEPIATTGILSMFRERMCDTKLTSIVGKNRAGYRYLLHEKNIWQLHLETGEFTCYANTAYLNSEHLKFDFGSDGALYYMYFYENKQNSYYYVDVYRYEYENHQKLASIRLFYKSPFVSLPMGLVIHDGILYFSTNYNAQSQYYIYCYQVPMNELATTSFLTPFFSGTYTAQASFSFQHENDLYAGCYRLKNFDSQQSEKISTEFVCAGERGDLLITGSAFLLIESNSLLPLCVSIGNLPQYAKQSFLYGNYLYSLINNYLFRTRIY